MNFDNDIELLERQLEGLAGETEAEWVKRYHLTSPRRPPGLYWQTRWLAGWALRRLESLGILRSAPWPVSLKQGGMATNARPLLIWAVGADRDALREACGNVSRLGDSLAGFAPVLITDVADFAFFSRLGWLVEYLPRMAGEGEPYEVRKAKFLASLYRGAPALPVSAARGWHPAEIRQWIVRCASNESRDHRA